ncbi:MAG: hypothetical protein ABEJ60_06205 [Halodesulfurarchaeum sp.]
MIRSLTGLAGEKDIQTCGSHIGMGNNLGVAVVGSNMPAASGASHGIAAFGSLIIGAVLSRYIWELVPPLGELALVTIRIIQSTTGANIPTSEQFAGAVVVMMGLSFAWGVIYHLGRHS